MSHELAQTAPVIDVPNHNATPRQSILVIEDDPRSARMLSATLTAEGYDVTLAASGEGVLSSDGEIIPDLIICDVLLPGMDGIELTRALRAKAPTAETPLLLVTSLDDRKVIARGLEAGADDILVKPINTLELRSRARSLLCQQALSRRTKTTAPPPVGAVEQGVGLGGRAMPSSPTENAAAARQPTILIVEDDDSECRLLKAYLTELECNVQTARDVQSALAALESDRIDLAILDLLLPDHSGYTLVEQMRGNPRHFQTPILIVSALAEVQDRVKALELGADDFIRKGFDLLEFQARVRRLLRLKQSLDLMNIEYHHVLEQSVKDGMTGLYTHGYLQEMLQRQIDSARRHRWPLSLLFLDIDHFKAINDRHGHAIGDEVLRTLGATIQSTLRGSDLGVRYGGEEFVVLLPHTNRADAQVFAERLRCTIAECGRLRSKPGGHIQLTVSIGVANFPEDATDAQALVQCADDAMYTAKRGGRNQVSEYRAREQGRSTQALVLIADDDARNLKLLEAYLQAEGYRTIRASDGQEAIDVARREQPELVLLDAMMPRMSGFDACRRMKSDHKLKLVPIILVTALNSRDDKLRGVEAGADDFLSKPIDKVALFTRMRALLKAKRETDSLEDAETVIFALARTVENRDPATGGHVERVSHYAAALGHAAGLSDSEVDGLRRAGVVHDIGKVAIPDEILLKPGALTDDERSVIQTHVEVGYELLKPMRTFSASLPAVRYHHERLDGSGYPFGLRNDEIPITAQILAIVDVFDALTTDRSYRAALPTTDAIGILREEAARGRHDPNLVELLGALVAGDH